MAINVSQSFHRTSSNAVDDTLTLTKAEMLAVNDNLMPAKYLTVCQDDGFIYLYDKSATPNGTTGKFTKFEGGGGGTSDYPDLTNKPSINSVTLSGNKTSSDLSLASSTDMAKAYKSDDTAFTAIDDADYVPVYDSSASTKKKSLWSNIKSVLKTYFDGYYQKILTAGNNIAISNANVISTTTSLSLNYSTSEQVIGKWVDNSTLYQKTIYLGTLPNKARTTIAHNISGTFTVVAFEGFAYYGTIQVPLPFIQLDSSSSPVPTAPTTIATIYSGSSVINLVTNDNVSSYKAYLTVKYIKKQLS